MFWCRSTRTSWTCLKQVTEEDLAQAEDNLLIGDFVDEDAEEEKVVEEAPEAAPEEAKKSEKPGKKAGKKKSKGDDDE